MRSVFEQPQTPRRNAVESSAVFLRPSARPADFVAVIHIAPLPLPSPSAGVCVRETSAVARPEQHGSFVWRQLWLVTPAPQDEYVDENTPACTVATFWRIYSFGFFL
jgi:hypothetical protein